MKPKRRRTLTIEEYASGVLEGNIAILSRAITLVESNLQTHQTMAQALLERLLPYTGNSLRIGITGVPGVGKSTLIESLGCALCDRGHKLAVLAIDPSSSLSGGSILGDKTRMENLVGKPQAFVRPSPSGGSLGGVSRKSRETIVLCEAAGYDVIFIETVGVGQNEVTVRSMVDCFMLVMLAGAGDELQGMKKGVIEIADLLTVNKADGDNIHRARLAATEYARVFDFIQPATKGWKTPATTCSAFELDSLLKLWEIIKDFEKNTRQSGMFEKRRKAQNIDWMHSLIEEGIRQRLFKAPRVAQRLPALQEAVSNYTTPVVAAAQEILSFFPIKE